MSCDIWTQQDIDDLKGIYSAYKAAYLTLLTGGVQSYTLDTGQSVQKVTKLDLEDLSEKMMVLEKQIDVLNNRVNGCGVGVFTPCF